VNAITDLNDFRAAFDRWANEMLGLAQQHDAVNASLANWRRQGSGVYVYSVQKEPQVAQEVYGAAFYLPAWKDVAAGGGALSAWLGDINLNVQDFALRTMDEALRVHAFPRDVRLNSLKINLRFEALADLVESDSVRTELVVVTDHLTLENSLTISGNILIEVLDDERLDTIVPLLIIPPDIASNMQEPKINVPWHGRVAIKKCFDTPKAQANAPAQIDLAGFVNEYVDRLQDCLALTARAQANPLGWFVRRENPLLRGAVGWARTGLQTAGEATATITDGSRNEICRLWGQIERAIPQKKENVRLALRRLRYAAERNTLEDRLLDVIIAAEALLLANLKRDNTELSLRASLRATLLLKGTATLPARKIFAVIKKAYDLRSEVAHGRALDDGKTYQIGDATMSAPELIDAAHDIVIDLTKAALDATEVGSYDPPWDEMLLEAISR
jgi:Apea-like HEPN